MEERKRHALIWKSVRAAVKPAIRLVFDFDSDIYREKGPMMVLANHNADLDPAFLLYAFPDPLYFVASEHIMRGFFGNFLRWATCIIPRQKGGSAKSTILSMIKHVQDGHDVCMFPEGNRSWDGVTRRISPTTGSVVRSAGGKLVTYRTEGLYFTNPRWSGGSLRRGKTHGTIVGSYDADYIQSLTDEEVQEIIERDLYENAYQRQRENPQKYRGLKLAEHLETLLFMCPHCHAEGKLYSKGNYFYCSECGTKLRYTPEGFFVGENCIYDSVLDWSIWQKERIREKCLNAGEDVIFEDTELDMSTVITGKGKEYSGRGILRMYRDRVELPDGTVLPISEIKRMSIRGPQDLYFSTVNPESPNYLITCKKVRCISKYLTAAAVFSDRLKYGI